MDTKNQNEDGLIFSESAEYSWRKYLSDFKENVWPVFKEKGFTSYDLAFNAWLLNRLNNDVCELIEIMEKQ